MERFPPSGELFISRMIFQNPVTYRISPVIVGDAINAVVIVLPLQFTGNPVCFKQLNIHFDRVIYLGICDHCGKRFTVLTPGNSHHPQLLRQTDRFSPGHKFMLNFIVVMLIFRQQLNPRTSTDGVIGKHLHQSLCIGIIGNFIPGAHTESFADLRICLLVCREIIGHCPVPDVVPGSLCRIKSADYPDRVFRRRGSAAEH